ncbi:AAA family ATPase [Flavobacterium aestuarii]|uniref:AAA family ATPase n=1 Tax=Flavobacterium aestuarii TaxID=3149227 RepID=UPI0032B4D116
MKLVAIWVEDFMKIKNQGFNFGGRNTYSFNFDQEKRILNINAHDTTDYYNLFGTSEIRNISGIIGINGSGKSSLLKLINVINAEKPLVNNVILIFENEQKNEFEIIDYVSTFFSFGKKQALNILLPKKGIFSEENKKIIQKKNINPFKEIDLIFYSNLSSNQNVNYLGLDNPLDRSVDYQLRQSLSPNKVSEYLKDYNKKKEGEKTYLLLEESFNLQSIYQNERLERMVNFLSDSIENQFSIIGDIKFPEKITIWFNENIFPETIKLIEKSEYDFNRLVEISKHCFKLYNEEGNFKEKLKKGVIFHYLFFAFYNDFFKRTGKLGYVENLSVFVKSLPLDGNIFNSIFGFLISHKSEKQNYEIDKINDLLKNLNVLLENIEISESKEFFGNGNFELSINEYLWNFLKEILLITDFKSEAVINYSITPFSSGEDAILYQLSEFHEAFKHSNKENIIISIDEGELYLHPEWQRKYINTIYQFFQHYGKKYDKKIQIIITSHSPFIVSDIPKHNLIFLKKDEKGNCKVSNSENHLPTMGGNIFELFNDGFYVKEFISEFAFDKINEAIKWLNDEKSEFNDILEVENFNKLIGESLIRDEIQKMIDFKKMKNFDEFFELIKTNKSSTKND